MCLPGTWVTILAVTDDGSQQLSRANGRTMRELTTQLGQQPRLVAIYEEGALPAPAPRAPQRTAAGRDDQRDSREQQHRTLGSNKRRRSPDRGHQAQQAANR